MAKSARASSVKRNRNNLRTKVFGPAHDSRLERLSAKLQELASKPGPQEERGMHVGDEGNLDEDAGKDVGSLNSPQAMDVDAGETQMQPAPTRRNKKKHMSSTEKKIVKRKAKNSIVFAPNAQRRKRLEAAKKRK